MPKHTLVFSNERPLRLGIVGGGAGTREFLIRFLEAGACDLPIVVDVFEPRGVLGRGIAWSAEKTPVLANMRVETLGPSYHEYDLIQSLLTQLGHSEASSQYPTRNAVGLALDERWRRQGTLPSQWQLNHICAEVVDIDWDGHTSTVYTADGAEHAGYDLILLSLGNIPERPPATFENNSRFVNGWNVSAVESIEAGSDVLIKGAGLTAIDATMRLLASGHKPGARSIVWHSRSGSLPFVRPRQLKLDPDHLTYPSLEALVRQIHSDNSRLTLATLMRLFRFEIASQSKKQAGRYAPGTDFAGFLAMYETFHDPAKGREFVEFGLKGADGYCLWFSVAKLFDEYVIPFVWNAMPDQEKAVFLEDWRRDFDRFWAPIPVENGRRLKQWLTDGTVQLVRTGINYQSDPGTGKVRFDSRLDDPFGELSKADLKERYKAGFDYLIDGGGIAADLEKLDSKLVNNLLRRGTMIPYKLRQTNGVKFSSLGARVDWYTGVLLAADGLPHSWIYTLTGSLTAGAHRFTNSYLAVSVSAQRVVVDLMKRLVA